MIDKDFSKYYHTKKLTKQPTNKTYKTYNYITNIIINYPQTNFITRKSHNKAQHIKNGNHYLSLVHWNKGKTLFHNKTTDIDQILSQHKPHIFSLCEANIERIINDTNNDTYLDYNIEHTKMSVNTNKLHNAILIKNDIIYNRRYDLEDEVTSTI